MEHDATTPGPPPVVAVAEDATPEWFTQVLRGAGVLPADASVASLTSARVGNGLVCESVRFELTYDPPTAASDAPASVVCKLPSTDAGYRKVAADQLLYTRETTFYADLAPSVDLRIPRCLHVGRDQAGGAFVLVLEDLGPAECGDQVSGCSLPQAQVVMDAAAGLHAPLWGDESLEPAAWNVRTEWLQHIATTYVDLFDQYATLFGDRVSEEDLEIGRVFAPAIASWFAGQPRPWTLTHGDFRLDNMLFAILGGAEPLAVVDWQTLMPGPGTTDVAYFLGGCLPTELRQDHEKDLLRHYHDALVSRGVADYSFDRCWDDYRYNTFLGYFMATYAAVLVQRTERGDQMFAVWLQRVAAQIRDLGALDLLPSS